MRLGNRNGVLIPTLDFASAITGYYRGTKRVNGFMLLIDLLMIFYARKNSAKTPKQGQALYERGRNHFINSQIALLFNLPVPIFHLSQYFQ